MVDRQFRLLGPLEARVADRPLPLGGHKPRMLLATLLLHPNRTVPTDRLVDVLWPQAPPRSAVANVRTYASTLRNQLRAGSAGQWEPITARRQGYTVTVGPHNLDVFAFDKLVGEARQLRDAGAAGAAADLLQLAVDMWRGDPLEDLPHSAVWDGELVRLAERRVATAEERLALLVSLGRYDTAIPELRALVAAYPLREGLWQQLMLALAGGGRRAEALRAYQDLHDLLAAELGIEPGPPVRAIRAAIAAGDPLPLVLDVDRGAGRAAPAARRAVCQLPPDVPDFTGRTDIAARLCETLRDADSAGPPVMVITGAPGVGKSALAVHVAHAVRAAFPDGQLHVDLGGTSPAPRSPSELLGELLRGLGVASAVIPDSVHERAAHYRSQLSGRRVLVLLDDAADAAQVRPLLTAAGSAVIVTSRRRLTGLAGAHHVALDVLDITEAQALLARLAGTVRVAAEPEVAASILQSCGHLPLAIRIAGAKLAGRQTWSLRVLADRLSDTTRRLTELRLGDLQVRASFDLSHRQLSPAAATAFRLLAGLGAHTVPAWVVGALLDRPGAAADDVLDALVDANLLQLVGCDAAGQPRYRLHELLRLYAEEAAAHDPPELREAALARVLDGWLTLARRAGQALPVSVIVPTDPVTPRWSLAGDTAARLVAAPLTWFDAERHNLVAAVSRAAAAGMAGRARDLAIALTPYVDLCGHYDDWRRTHQVALRAVRRSGDRRGQAALLRGLGQLHLYRDAYPRAVDMLRRARRRYAEISDRRGEASAVAGLGAVHRVRGRLPEALRHYRWALRVFVAHGDHYGEAYARNAVGMVWLARGRPDAALPSFAAALRWSRQLGDRHREAHVSHQIARLHTRQGRDADAMAWLREALAIFADIGDRQGEAYALQDIANLHAAAGNVVAAVALLERALASYRLVGDRRAEATACEQLGELYVTDRRLTAARSHWELARRLWRDLAEHRGESAATARLQQLDTA